MSEKRCLYVGGDDSNHAGDSKGEIIVAPFSSDVADSIVRNFQNTRDLSALERWLEKPGVDYRFTLLTADQARHSGQNLIRIVPAITDAYLAELNPVLDELKIYLDGRMAGGSRDWIRKHFLGRYGIKSVVVDNFIKKTRNIRGRIEKHPHCPPIVYYADVLAHALNQMTFEELSHHEKLVVIKDC